ncbi:MAG: glucose 1-dehydrogenase [Dehalococcoidia bacterium]|nr:glucose 1-dehydrogenase [Dehalococcoidia bacterium]
MTASGRLDGKVAIITGAGSGIGQATAELFAREGAAVVVVDISARKANQTVENITSAGGAAVTYRADVRRADEVSAFVDAAVENYGRLDILFNNAGTTRAAKVTELSEDDWQVVIDTNLKATYLGAKFAIPVLARGGGGAIINTASISGILGEKEAPAYGAAKAGVISLTRCLAVDHAAQGIRTNCICPGVVATPPIEWLFSDESARQQVANLSPMGRMATAGDIASTALFLASDEAAFINGASIVVDGGLTIQSPLPAVGSFPLKQPG